GMGRRGGTRGDLRCRWRVTPRRPAAKCSGLVSPGWSGTGRGSPSGGPRAAQSSLTLRNAALKNTGSAMNEPGQDPAPALQTAGCAAEELTPQRPAANASSSGQGQTEADQAIFTSIDSPRGGGYQLAAKSEGISLAEARELSAWGPSHDSLWETDEAAGSCNFHRLQSGRLAISRSIHGAAEYSGRGGRSVYTHYLVLSADDFARWDSNPFDVLRAASHTE